MSVAEAVSDADWSVKFIEMPKDFVIYKCVGDERTLRAYCEKWPKGRNASDWSAIYAQFNRAHALGTLGYRFDQGYSEATLLQLKLAGTARIVIIGGDSMACE